MKASRLAVLASLLPVWLSPEAGKAETVQTVIQMSYDTMGRVDCVTARMNSAQFASLPSSACTLGTQGSAGPDRITKNTYDAAGQLLVLTRALGTTDQADDATYTWSANGKQASIKDANGNLATMSYDGFDRQSQWNFPSPTTVGQTSTRPDWPRRMTAWLITRLLSVARPGVAV